MFAGYLEIPDRSYESVNKDPHYINGAEAQFHLYKDLTEFCDTKKSSNGH